MSTKRKDARDDDGELPSIIEGGLQFFEAFAGAGKSRVSFQFVRSHAELPCNFCGDRTKTRLAFEIEGETNQITVCDDCKAGIGDAARVNG